MTAQDLQKIEDHFQVTALDMDSRYYVNVLIGTLQDVLKDGANAIPAKVVIHDFEERLRKLNEHLNERH